MPTAEDLTERGQKLARPRGRPGWRPGGWRSPSPKRREKGKEPEVPKERTTATQGEEEGEMEVIVPEGGEAVEMEE